MPDGLGFKKILLQSLESSVFACLDLEGEGAALLIVMEKDLLGSCFTQDLTPKGLSRVELPSDRGNFRSNGRIQFNCFSEVCEDVGQLST